MVHVIGRDRQDVAVEEWLDGEPDQVGRARKRVTVTVDMTGVPAAGPVHIDLSHLPPSAAGTEIVLAYSQRGSVLPCVAAEHRPGKQP